MVQFSWKLLPTKEHKTIQISATWSEFETWFHSPESKVCLCCRRLHATGWRSDRIYGVSVIHSLPHHHPAGAEKIPEVADDSTVKGVLLMSTVLQVRDPVTWHELPGGGVDGDQVEVTAQQQHYHHREDTCNSQRRQQEPVHSEPQLPCDTGGDARPVR